MIHDYIDLIRVRQWYKNLLVFLALFFAGALFNWADVRITLLAFFSLSFISSVGYILNDLVDLEKDKSHPEKKLRSLASGKVSKSVAGVLGIVLLLFGFGISFLIGLSFVYVLASFFALSLLYTFVLKKIIFADVIAISLFFVARAVAGAIAINVYISPWLILCPFFLALFLAVGKRHSDLLLLKEKAGKTRDVLADYTLDLTNSLMIVSTTLLLISYALYSFFSNHQNFIIALPFAVFVVFRYYYLIQSGSVIAREPEKLLKDKQMVIGIVLWGLVTFLLLYMV